MEELKEISIGIAISILSASILFLSGYFYFKWRGKAIKKIEYDNLKKRKKIQDQLDRTNLSKKYYKSIINNNKEFGLSRFAITGKYGFGKTFIIDEIGELHQNKFQKVALKFKAWEQDEFYSPLKRILIEVFKNRKQFNLTRNELRTLKVLLNSDNIKLPLAMKQYIQKYQFLKYLFSKSGSKEHKILFLIDELDRATPSDVIEFLELTNHLFGENENVIVVYSYDKNNLKKIISNHLGIEDAKYIKKFIDFEFKLLNENIKYINKIEYDDEFNWLKGVIINRDINISLRDIDFWRNKFLLLKRKIKNGKIKKILPQILMSLELGFEGYDNSKEYEGIIRDIFIKTIKNCYGNFSKKFNLSLYSIEDFKIFYDNQLLILNKLNKRHGMMNYEYLIQLIQDEMFDEEKFCFKFELKEDWFRESVYRANPQNLDIENIIDKIYQVLNFRINYFYNDFDILFVAKENNYNLEEGLSFDFNSYIEKEENEIIKKLNAEDISTIIGNKYKPKVTIDSKKIQNTFKKIKELNIKAKDLNNISQFIEGIKETYSFKFKQF